MNKDTLGSRMKEYEAVWDYTLTRRCPIICRCDGRSFHNVTRGLEKPCYELIECMANTMKDVASDIEGCVFGYCQSDEITFVLRNDQSIKSMPWFMNRLQKMVSIAAAETTLAFNKNLAKNEKLSSIIKKKAVFDARVFIVPSVTEVNNNILWRQKDCIKNSISLAVDNELRKKLGKSKSLSMLLNTKSKERIEILKQEIGIDFWSYYPSRFIRGVATYKRNEEKKTPNGDTITRSTWYIDYDIPEFTKDPRLILNCFVDPIDSKGK